MGNLSKLKIAIGQPELIEGMPTYNTNTKDKMIVEAVDAGADILALPGSLTDKHKIHVVALNDSRIDVAGSVIFLEAAGERYQIGIGDEIPGSDFSIVAHLDPWSLKQIPLTTKGIVLRPVGILNRGNKVVTFDGGTSIYNKEGELSAHLRDDFESDFEIISFSHYEKKEDYTSPYYKLMECLIKTLRRFDEQVITTKPKLVIGLSGGLDSAVVAALLVKAFGPKRVIAYNMTTEFNSKSTRANASQIAQCLGIECMSGAITDLVATTELVVEQFGYGGKDNVILSGSILENVQARVRGHLLSTFAAIEKGIAVCNGNRIEGAFGYSTLHGDIMGGIAPLANLTKVQIIELAHTINGSFKKEVIPLNLLPKESKDGYVWKTMPSAELYENQKDPMKWFYHDWLIQELFDVEDFDAAACSIMERYLESNLLDTDISKWVHFYHLDDPEKFIEDFDWVLSTVQKNVHKRLVLPPVITVSSPVAIRRSIETQGEIEFSKRFQELRDKIIATYS